MKHFLGHVYNSKVKMIKFGRILTPKKLTPNYYKEYEFLGAVTYQ